MNYYTEQEKAFLAVMKSNIEYHNAHHKARLSIREYIADGNRIDIAAGMIPILSGLTVENAFWCIAAICNYADGVKKK